MSDTREAIAQAISELFDEGGDTEFAQAIVRAATDAVLPLVAEAEQRGYDEGYAAGERAHGVEPCRVPGCGGWC